MIVFYDFEVFKYDWLVVLINPFDHTKTVIVNEVDKLQRYYDKNKDLIWCGYNVRHYDQYILKGLLCGFNAWDMNDFIINKGGAGWQYSNLLNKIKLINYDVALLNSSLKQLEGFQGHNIHESSVDFRINRKLTQAEIEETITYCTNDVEEAINIWLEKKADFDVQLELIKEFELPISDIAKTQTQLTAEILEAQKHDYGDDFDITLQPYLNNIKKYKCVVDKYREYITKEHLDDDTKTKIYKQKFSFDIAGVLHVFGWGGAHGAIPQYYGEGIYLHIDVHQYYPSLVIANDYFPRGVTAEGRRRYAMMKNESVRLKAFPELKNKRNGYKLCNNKMTGGMKDKNSKLYDPKNNNNICVGGQLAILLLIEMLEPYCKLIQSNTDGIIVKLPSLKVYETIDDICYQWEQMTGVSLGFDPIIIKIYQKDVNNYLFINVEGKIERKGAYVKELNKIDNDLPIINKALNEYMVNGTPVERTINECDELIQFQKICKLTSNFDYATHNGKRFYNKCYRIFASKRSSDDAVYKVKTKGVRGETQYFKFGNTSGHSFIENGDITDTKAPRHLDKDFYINLAYERLRQYGIDTPYFS